MKAVIPAAGLGTRFLPATKAQPKEMLPVYDKPAIQYVVEEAVAAGIDDIIIVTGRNKRSIEDHFDKSYELEYTLQKAGKDLVLKEIRNVTDLADIYYVKQKSQKGLGDAILQAEKHIGDEPFAVLLGDTITVGQSPGIRQLMDVYAKFKKPFISIDEVSKDKIERYGIVSGDKIEDSIYKLTRLVEKPLYHQAPSNLAIMGRYLLTPDIFDKIRQTKPGVKGEIQLTDALSKLDEIYGVKLNARTYDMSYRLDWIKNSIEFALAGESKDELIEYIKNEFFE